MEDEPKPRARYEPAPRREFGVLLSLGLFLYFVSCLTMLSTLKGLDGSYVADAVLFRFGLFFVLIGLALLVYRY